MKIELSQDEHEILLRILGYAAAMGIDREGPAFVAAVLRIANIVNKDHPDWRPYDDADAIAALEKAVRLSRKP